MDYWDSGIWNRNGVGVMDTNRNRYDRNTKVKGSLLPTKNTISVSKYKSIKIHSEWELVGLSG